MISTITGFYFRIQTKTQHLCPDPVMLWQNCGTLEKADVDRHLQSMRLTSMQFLFYLKVHNVRFFGKDCISKRGQYRIELDNKVMLGDSV